MSYSAPAVPPDTDPTQASLECALVARDVDLTYKTKSGRIAALEGFTLYAQRNQFVSLIGPSGCGKSTFLRLAAGLMPVTAGEISLLGKPVTGPRSDVSVVFQKPTLMPWKTVLENTLVGARSLGLDLQESTRVAHELLRRVGLEDFAGNHPNELSGGMQQRVGIVRALVHNPSMLLMDEPFAALDAMTREYMAMMLQGLWSSTDKTVLFITHSIAEAVFLSDRVVVLSGRPGKIIDDVPIELSRPRSMDIMAAPEFGELCHHLRSRLSHEVNFI